MFDVEGEEGFRIREEKVIGELAEQQGIVLATGGGAIKSRETRNKLFWRGIAVYLETTIESNWRVPRERQTSPLVANWKSRPMGAAPGASALERNVHPRMEEEVADFIIRDG